MREIALLLTAAKAVFALISINGTIVSSDSPLRPPIQFSGSTLGFPFPPPNEQAINGCLHDIPNWWLYPMAPKSFSTYCVNVKKKSS